MKVKYLNLCLAPILGLALVMLFITIIQPPALAAGITYYVATTGDDSRTLAEAQSSGTPWKTITHAVASVPAGSDPANPNIISVTVGTYDTSNNGESFPIILDKANVTLMGAGVGNTIIDGETTTDTLQIDATGVTVQDFTIYNAGSNGILASVGGFTVTQNSFISVTQGVNLNINANPTGSYTLTDIAVFSNTFDLDQVTNGTGVRLYATLNFSAAAGSTASIGNIDVSHNVITLSTTNDTGIDLNYLDIKHLNSGQIFVGDVTIEANTVISGRYGIEYENSVSYITDTVVTVGQTSFNHNILQNQSGSGIDTTSGNGNEYWYGASSGAYGNVSINFNNITSNDANSGAIGFRDYADWTYLYGTSTITTGNFSLNNNTIEVNGIGIYVFYYYVEYLYNDASVIVGDILVQNNSIKAIGSNKHGIDIQFEGGSKYNNSAYKVGEINVSNNHIKATGRAIFLEDYAVGYNTFDNAAVTQGDMTIENNTLDAAAEGVYIYHYEMGYMMYSNAALSVGELSVISNTITGTTGIYFEYETVAYEMRDNATVNLGKTRISSNTLKATSAAGIYIYHNSYGVDLTGTTKLINDGYEIINNNISAASHGIHFDYASLGENMEDSASVSHTSTTIQTNVISAADKAIYFQVKNRSVANNLQDTTSVSLDDIYITNNRIINAAYGIYNKHEGYSGQLYGNSTANSPKLMVTGNAFTVTSDGIYDYYNDGAELYNNAQFTLGGLYVDDNTFNNGVQGIYRNFYEHLQDVANDSIYTIDSFSITNNRFYNQSGTAIYFDGSELIYDIEHNARATMSDTLVTNNIIDGADDGIDLDYTVSTYDTNIVSIGQTTISGNILSNIQDKGIYFEHDIYLSQLSSQTFGDVAIYSNTVTAGGDGIYIYNNSGSQNLNESTSLNVGKFTVVNNTVSVGENGLELRYRRVGDRIYSNTTITLAEVTVEDNSFETNSSANASVYVYFDNAANIVNDSAQITFGDINLDANQMIGGSDSVEIYYKATNKAISNTATVKLPTYNLVNNVMARGVDNGVQVNGNAPVNLIHNTIVSPTLSSGAGVKVMTGTVQLTNTIIATFTTGISQSSGTVSEDYTLFAGTTANTGGTVVTGTHSISNGNPAFTDPTNNDYTLLESSDAIDNGVNAGITVDKDNKSRYTGNGYDLGAYESSILTYLPLIMKNN